MASNDSSDKKNLKSLAEGISNALQNWQEISIETEKNKTIAPDEQILKDIKGILKNIKEQIKEFDKTKDI